MVSNSFSQDKQGRLAILRRFEGIDASPETALDSITALIAWFFNVPISTIGVISRDHIIVKSLYGLEMAQADRLAEWCAAAIATDDIFCITNALEDPLAKADPLVAGEFGLRFYAAAPLRTREGYSMGTLSVIDRKPRDISVSEKEFLRRMASLVVDLIESRLIGNRLTTFIASLANEAPRPASPAADERLLQVLAENLAQVLDVAYVFIGASGELGDGMPATVAFYATGAAIGQAQDQFPHERRMADLRIESYAGIKLTDSALQGFGAIAILDTKPIKDLGLMRTALAAFAGLALAELK